MLFFQPWGFGCNLSCSHNQVLVEQSKLLISEQEKHQKGYETLRATNMRCGGSIHIPIILNLRKGTRTFDYQSNDTMSLRMTTPQQPSGQGL